MNSYIISDEEIRIRREMIDSIEDPRQKLIELNSLCDDIELSNIRMRADQLFDELEPKCREIERQNEQIRERLNSISKPVTSQSYAGGLFWVLGGVLVLMLSLISMVG